MKFLPPCWSSMEYLACWGDHPDHELGRWESCFMDTVLEGALYSLLVGSLGTQFGLMVSVKVRGTLCGSVQRSRLLQGEGDGGLRPTD